MIAQIYTKTNEDFTSIVVSNDKGNIYFQEVLDVPEITGIQRGASFVKNNLDSDVTEIYPDNINENEIMKDAYINYCRINHKIGKDQNIDAKNLCETNLKTHLRWNSLVMRKNYER